MDVRKKLVELLRSAYGTSFNAPYLSEHELEPLASHLIANGVTVQEEAKLYWKPVNPGEWNLTCSACDSHLGCREDANFCLECGAKFVYPKAVAPQPPKGE